MIDRMKKSLRVAARDRLRELSSEDVQARSVEVCQRFTEMTVFQQASVVMMYLPLAYEVDCKGIALRAWQQGKTVTVPLVNWEQKHMIAVELKSFQQDMAESQHGVKTPKQGRPIPTEMVDLVVVPGLAFDRQGHRLGRGGGFYDRFLGQKAFRGLKCGVCFAEQIVDDVPVAGHDITLDTLVTDTERLIIRRRGRRVRRSGRGGVSKSRENS